MATSKRNVTTIAGLQALLGEGVAALGKIRSKDLPWARTMISAVNSGNSLLRTEALIAQQAESAER